MNSTIREQVLQDALRFLHTTTMSVLEVATMMVVLPRHPSLKALRRRYIQQLTQANHSSQSLQDLFASLLVIQQEVPGRLNGELIAQAVNRLVANECNPGGPYMMEGKIDRLTNLLIHRFLTELGALPPGLESYVARLSPSAKPSLANFLILQANRLPDTLGSLLSKATNLTELQNPDGSWGVGQSCVLQTSLVVRELLESSSSPDTFSLSAEQNAVAIYGKAREQITLLPVELRESAGAALENVRQADRGHEIVLISWFFSLSWNHNELGRSRIAQYGLANLWLWVSYTIYDDILDQEDMTQLLPLANVMHRLSLDTYRKIALSDTHWQTTVLESFNCMDSANSWELERCRFRVTTKTIQIADLPDYGSKKVLARRAQGHIIGPLLELRGSGLSHLRQLAVKQGLDQYLIARQLNDDVHDWKQDFQKGHISFVVAYLLKSVNIEPKSYSLKELTAQLETHFWHKGFSEICRMILASCKDARRLLAEDALITDGPFIQLIASIEKSVQDSRRLYKNQRQFFSYYNNTH